MKQYIIECNDRVDIVHRDNQLASRSRLGWKLVADMTGQEEDEIPAFAHRHASQTGKCCLLTKPATNDERGRVLARVYCLLVGTESFAKMAELYREDPEAVMHNIQKVFGSG